MRRTKPKVRQPRPTRKPSIARKSRTVRPVRKAPSRKKPARALARKKPFAPASPRPAGLSDDLARARLAAIVDSSEDAIVSKNLDGIILSWNAAAERMFGHSAAEAIGKSINLIIPADRRNEEVEIISRVRRGEHVDHFDTVRLTKSGERIDIAITVSPVRDARGVIIGASKIARDISERKAREEHQKILLAELDHRVKNMLAVVSSIATQTIQTTTTLDEFASAFEGRIQALAHAHKLLSKFQWKGTLLTSLLEQVVLTFCRDKIQCGFDKQEVMLPARAALALALVFHELATNASKYGALSNSSGSVRIAWDLKSDGPLRTLRLTWTETDGPLVNKPTKSGFGTTLIEKCIRYEFGGNVRFEYKPHGFRCLIEMNWSTQADKPQ